MQTCLVAILVIRTSASNLFHRAWQTARPLFFLAYRSPSRFELYRLLVTLNQGSQGKTLYALKFPPLGQISLPI